MFVKKINNKEGFTLVELLMSILILVPLFTIVMQSFIQCMQLNDLANHSSAAVSAVKSRLAAIENTNFSQIYTTYNNTTFTVTGLNSKGKTYVDNSNANHVVVTISVSWRERDGRIIGEDKNLNGTLDAGEDSDGDGKLSSLVGVTTQVYDMSS